jgi:Cu/Ag efflux protein CusF
MQNRTLPALVLAGCLGVTLTACGASDNGDTVSTGQADMPGMPAMNANTAAPAMHVAEGMLNSIDVTAGTVNISHGPVAGADWPSMTMTFKLADRNAARALATGQRVRFEFTIESSMEATVTKLTAIE